MTIGDGIFWSVFLVCALWAASKVARWFTEM